MRHYTVIAAAVLLVACATFDPGHLVKPTLTTHPGNYLETVGLDRHSQSDVLSRFGPPDQTTEAADMEFWSYRLSDGGARRTFVYVFDGDVLHDVRYQESGLPGPYDGMSARDVQGL